MKIGIFEGTVWVWPKVSGTRGCPATNHSSCQKTRWIDIFILWFKNFGSTCILFRFVRVHAFDGRTDIQISTARLCVCIRSGTVRRYTHLREFFTFVDENGASLCTVFWLQRIFTRHKPQNGRKHAYTKQISCIYIPLMKLLGFRVIWSVNPPLR